MHRFHCLEEVMYRSNRSFKIPPPPSPGQTPRHLTFLKIIVQILPYPGQNAVQMPHTMVHSGDQMPPPRGTFHRHKTDRGTAETPSVVEQNLYKYNKNWETLLAYLLRTKFSCKAAEIAATRSLNAQLFFVCYATYKTYYKKNPTYYHYPFYYIMTISLTCIMAHLIHAAGQGNWPLLSFLLLHWIAGNRYCISL